LSFYFHKNDLDMKIRLFTEISEINNLEYLDLVLLLVRKSEGFSFFFKNNAF
jgi:hypothetical protein